LFLKEQPSFLYVGEICRSHGHTEAKIVAVNQNVSSYTVLNHLLHGAESFLRS